MFGPRDGCYDVLVEIDPEVIDALKKENPGLPHRLVVGVVREFVTDIGKTLPVNEELKRRLYLRGRRG
jgi:hypothetical protein